MILYSEKYVFAKCSDCNGWTNLCNQELIVLYLFMSAPLLNWFFYRCEVCEDDEYVFTKSVSEPDRLITFLEEFCQAVTVETDLPSSVDLDLYLERYGNIPQEFDVASIDTAVAIMASDLDAITFPVELIKIPPR